MPTESARAAIRVLNDLRKFRPSTYSHSLQTAVLSVAFANVENASLKENNGAQLDINEIFLAALTHDVGKLSIPNKILDAPYKLSANAKRIVDSHDLFAANYIYPNLALQIAKTDRDLSDRDENVQIALDSDGCADFSYIDETLPNRHTEGYDKLQFSDLQKYVALHHHAIWPDDKALLSQRNAVKRIIDMYHRTHRADRIMQGNEPLENKIIAISDAASALTENRAYRTERLTLDQALRYLYSDLRNANLSVNKLIDFRSYGIDQPDTKKRSIIKTHDKIIRESASIRLEKNIELMSN